MQNDTFIEDFFESDIYKEVIARNDKEGKYVVKTTSDSMYLLERDSVSCTQLHFQEEILMAIKECS